MIFFTCFSMLTSCETMYRPDVNTKQIKRARTNNNGATYIEKVI